MVKVPIHHVGRAGIIRDLPAHELPPEAWSNGDNVCFSDDVVKKDLGLSAAFDPPTVDPYWVMWAAGLTSSFWIYGSTAKVYVVDPAGVHTDITRTVGGDYSMDVDILWNGGVLGGIPIINNGVDDPQRWATIAAATKLDDLPNWPASTSARIIRPFKAFLVALDITLSGVRSPHKIMWSHPADPGSVPPNWAFADPTSDSGETELTDTGRGFLVDALQLGDILVVYKQSSVWGMQLTGGRFIFRLFPLFDGFGAFSKHCITQVGAKGPARHFLFTGDDVVVHDGRTMASVLDQKSAKWLQKNLDATNLGRAFCVTNYPEKECWFCFPLTGADWPNKAIVWNWERNTVTNRDLVLASFIGVGNTVETPGVADTWTAAVGIWDTDTESWGGTALRPTEQRLLQADPIASKLLRVDETEQLDGVDMVSFIERTGLAIAGVDRNNQPVVDFGMRKLVSRIWIRLTGGPVNVRVGAQENIDDTIVWQPTKTFDPSIEKYLDFEAEGRLIAVRFEGIGTNSWTLKGYDLEVSPLGDL